MNQAQRIFVLAFVVTASFAAHSQSAKSAERAPATVAQSMNIEARRGR